MNWREVTWDKYVEWVKGKTISNVIGGQKSNIQTFYFTDGSEAEFYTYCQDFNGLCYVEVTVKESPTEIGQVLDD